MARDHLVDAHKAYAGGDASTAVDHLWKAVRPAAVQQDNNRLSDIASLARSMAESVNGPPGAEARQLAEYCEACKVEPRSGQGGVLSTKRLFSFGGVTRRKCPDCAERIAVDARVCRFCGMRFDSQE